MLLPAVLLTVALGQAPQNEVWLPAHPVAMPGLAEATCAVDAAPWIAFVQVLPLPDSLRRFHAPRRPWRLVRAEPNGAPDVVADAEARSGGGWGAPSFVAVAADGTVTATWRPGHEVLIAPPQKKAALHRVPYDSPRSCMGLSTTWIVHREDRTGALFARSLTAAGPGEDVPLDAVAPGTARAAFGAPWLAWIESDGHIAAIDVATRQKRSIALPATQRLEFDGIWNGRLLMHDNGDRPQVHVIDLDRAVRWPLPAPASVIWCVPEGVFVNGGFWDPVGGTLRRVEQSPGWRGISQVLRRGKGVLWLRGRPRGDWHELRTLADPVAIPDSPPQAPLPEVPPQPTGEAGEAARSAWRDARGH